MFPTIRLINSCIIAKIKITMRKIIVASFSKLVIIKIDIPGIINRAMINLIK